MAIEITVPQLGESIVEATVGTWHKHEGEAVTAGEAVVELETDKVNLEVSAPQDGTLAAILKPEGTTVTIGETLGRIDPSSQPAQLQGEREKDDLTPGPSPTRRAEAEELAVGSSPTRRGGAEGLAADATANTRGETGSAPAAQPAEQPGVEGPAGTLSGDELGDGAARATPLARRMAADHGIDLATIKGTGSGGRITHEDVTAMIATAPNGAGASASASARGATTGETVRAPATGAASERVAGKQQDSMDRSGGTGSGDTPALPATAARGSASVPAPAAAAAGSAGGAGGAGGAGVAPARAGVNGAREEHVRMSRRRQTIARRLVEAQHTAAMLTTFNEVDMSAIMELRKRRRDQFKERHGVGLGFMSFFTRAVVGALKAYPRLNAELRGDEMVLKHYYDIGIAVSTDEGLVVPVVRDADRLTFAEIEREIATLAQKARNRTLGLDDLQGGTFTITNGGVFGSLLSTPILNGPQVGILGMHKIQERPIALAGQVVIHPMMYVAVSYDHRIVDGAESVSFLVRVKELLEDPEALLLEG